MITEETKKREYENIANGNKGYNLITNNETESNSGNMNNKINNYIYKEEGNIIIPHVFM